VSESFRIVGTKSLLHSYVFDVERRTVEHAGELFERDVVTHNGAVAVLAINGDDEVGLIRQYRSPFDTYTWEIPAGTLDVEGEAPLATAKRELREELGCEAGEWRLLGQFMVSPGWTNQLMNIYEARDLVEVERSPAGPEETSSTIHWVTIAKLKDTFRREPAMDSTAAIALHRVFGSFFDGD
jgi:ADP-ribose pyrophosphatase